MTRRSRANESFIQNVQVVQGVQTVRELLGSGDLNVLNGLNELNAVKNSSESNPLVEICGVSKSFHKTVKQQTTEVKALADVNLSIRENEFISIIGPSGCGKTTLLKMIDGLIPYDSGKILIDGKQVVAPGPDRAVVFQSFALLPWRTVLANVEFSLELRQLPKEDRAKTARDYLKRVGLADFENHYPHELSGGMQQRAGLARALAVNPSILLMDEPFGAVDAQTRQLLQEELLELWQRERKTVIFITHSMDEAVYLSDRVVVMTPRPGKVAEILDVPLPRPRVSEEVRRDVKFVDLTNYIWESLKKAMENHR
jgi:NitT/TauT family transport system ATP-binding protein